MVVPSAQRGTHAYLRALPLPLLLVWHRHRDHRHGTKLFVEVVTIGLVVFILPLVVLAVVRIIFLIHRRRSNNGLLLPLAKNIRQLALLSTIASTWLRSLFLLRLLCEVITTDKQKR